MPLTVDTVEEVREEVSRTINRMMADVLREFYKPEMDRMELEVFMQMTDEEKESIPADERRRLERRKKEFDYG